MIDAEHQQHEMRNGDGGGGDSLSCSNGSESNNDSPNSVLSVQLNGGGAQNKEGSSSPRGVQKGRLVGNANANEVELIELDDDDEEEEVQEEEEDDVIPIEEPPVKRSRARSKPPSPVPEDPKTSSCSTKESTPNPSSQQSSSQSKALVTASSSSKKEPELTSYSALLDRLEGYVKGAIDKEDNVERRVLDALLAAINILVQKEPYSVRKLILDKQLVLPNTISFPPSQVVDLLIEHDPDFQLSRVITKMFGEERPKLSDMERRERQQLKMANPAPHMTKLLMDIGLDLVQENTYSDIVHARNLPEVPKNMDTYKQVAAQLKPVWEALKAKNSPFRIQVFTCQVAQCGFKTDSRTVLSIHRQTPHFLGRKFQCAMCSEFDTNENRINRHYLQAHNVKVVPRDDQLAKVQCPICEEDFAYKGHRDAHLKLCKRDVNRIHTLQASRAPEHIGMINRWLWDKPPVEPTITAQQAEIRRAEQLKQQQQLLQQRQMAAATAAAIAAQQAQQSNTLSGRLLAAQAQQRMNVNAKHAFPSPSNNNPNNRQQLGQMLRNGGASGNFTPQMIQAAMQAQIRQQQLLQQAQQQAALAAKSSATPNYGQRGMGQTKRTPMATPTANNTQFKNSLASSLAAREAPSSSSSSSPLLHGSMCEICDAPVSTREQYLAHLKETHSQLKGKTHADMVQGAPLACSRCRDRFWTYEGLERHLVMGHGLVTSDLLTKAQRKEDGGKCKLCGKQYAFNMLQHLVSDHQVKLCSAEIMYSCDVCSFKCSSYQKLESHLSDLHPKQMHAPSR